LEGVDFWRVVDDVYLVRQDYDFLDEFLGEGSYVEWAGVSEEGVCRDYMILLFGVWNPSIFSLVIDHILAPVIKVPYGPRSLLRADLQ
jgi:hypothetical protein